MQPDFLAVGHIVKDVVEGGWRPGGGVFYAAAQARALGLSTAIATRCAGDISAKAILPDVDWHIAPSEITTSFNNVYIDGRRRQTLPSLAESIGVEDIPREWRRGAVIVLLAPVFHDVDESCAGAFTSPKRFLGLGAQGWLRSLDGNAIVHGPAPARPAWLQGDVAFASEEDVTDPESISQWRKRIARVVLTRGARGCTVWDASGRIDMPAFTSRAQDPTGAGDIFATAFLIRLQETDDSAEAAQFASAAASLAVSGIGATSVANRAQIDSLLSRERVRA